MIRLGLCCVFAEAPIRFRTATAAALARLAPPARRARLAAIAAANAAALGAAVDFCGAHAIGSFRVNSQILPLCTHPTAGYRPAALVPATVAAFRAAGARARALGIRLTFHPDQFVVLSSPDARVVAASLAELEYQAAVAEWIGADVITLHGGGAYGEPAAALARLARSLGRLSDGARRRVALENDDRIYGPADLAPVCRAAGVPLVYDVHHHRCRPDGLSVAAATRLAVATWDREPLLHVSSPLAGWDGPHPERHHDFIDPADFPRAWSRLEATVEVEAKAKELAIARLARDLAARGVRVAPSRR